MAVLIHHTGGDWTQELYDDLFPRVIDRSNPPSGMIAHFGASGDGGGWQVWDVWESEDAWERFRDESVIPAAQDMGAPPFDSKVTPIHNQLVA
jgi:hypothetical protein